MKWSSIAQQTSPITKKWSVFWFVLLLTVSNAMAVSIIETMDAYRDDGVTDVIPGRLSSVFDDGATAGIGAGMSVYTSQDGLVIVNYVGDFSGIGIGRMMAALKFIMPQTSATLASATLYLNVYDQNNSPYAKISLASDNTWEETSEDNSSTFPDTTSLTTLINNQSVSSSGWNAFSLPAGNVQTKISSLSADTMSLVVTGSTTTDEYFNFYSDNDANNNGGSTSNNAYLVLTFKPRVQSVSVPTNGTYKIGDALDFTVTFDSSVVVTGTPQIPLTLNTGGTVYASYISGSNSHNLVFRYTVASGDLDADGVCLGSAISLNSGTIKSHNGGEAELNLYNVAQTINILVDGTAPSIGTVSRPSGGTYIIGEVLDFIVNFDEEVNVVVSGGTPYLTLDIGGSSVQALYSTGTGTSALTFRYTVVSGDSDADGVAVASNVTLNRGTIKDAAGNDAIVTFTGSTATGVFVDAVAPAISIVTGPSAGTYEDGDTLWFNVAFDEDVSVSGTPSIGLTIGSTARRALYVSGSGTDTLKFGYEVVSGDADVDGIGVDASISLNEGSIADDAGNAAPLDLGTFDTEDVFVNTPPTIMVQKNMNAAGYSLRRVSSSGLFHVELPAGARHAEIFLLDAAGRKLAVKSLDVSSSNKDVYLPSLARWDLAILRVDGHVKATARGSVPLR